MVGAEALALDFLDCELYPDNTAARPFVDLIRRTQPDLIITHHPDDYYSDHRAVSKLVVDASFSAGLAYYVTDLPAVEVTPSIYFMDTLAGIDFAPEEYVDITSTIELKLAAMRSHVSQVTWIRDHHASDIEDLSAPWPISGDCSAGWLMPRDSKGCVPGGAWARRVNALTRQ